jgi:hypothetical protein
MRTFTITLQRKISNSEQKHGGSKKWKVLLTQTGDVAMVGVIVWFPV